MSRPQMAPEKQARIRELRKSGMSYARIAAEVGCSKPAAIVYGGDRPDAKFHGAARPPASSPGVGVPRMLAPGDWLEHPETGVRIGFVWDVALDRVEVRSYDDRPSRPAIIVLTRAEACWYRIVPNPAYGDKRPLLK